MGSVIYFPTGNVRSEDVRARPCDCVSFMTCTSLEDVLALVAEMAAADHLLCLSISALARDGHVLHIEVEVGEPTETNSPPESA